jgi:hypothetical protein
VLVGSPDVKSASRQRNAAPQTLLRKVLSVCSESRFALVRSVIDLWVVDSLNTRAIDPNGANKTCLDTAGDLDLRTKPEPSAHDCQSPDLCFIQSLQTDRCRCRNMRMTILGEILQRRDTFGSRQLSQRLSQPLAGHPVLSFDK